MGSNGARRHRCLVCERHFKRTEHLTRHLRRHTQEKPYQCQECLQCFARKELYQRHQQRFHGASQGYIPAPRVIATLSCPPSQTAAPASPSGNSSHMPGSTAPVCNSNAGITVEVAVPQDALPSAPLQTLDRHQAESTRAWSETPNEGSNANIAESRRNSLDPVSSQSSDSPQDGHEFSNSYSTIPSTVTTTDNPDPIASTIPAQ
ncbi:Respiration factor 2 [Trichoderma lentiforme]|uniref:Respiration factor 2 n=1 Tax=Trichoderma lentiforme TaxID=1567552 RepID=A0A9P4XF40_9HYPO|nr:Respiration factor 2 [Trichoderma lentiforme]